jgi:hypothetical protein
LEGFFFFLSAIEGVGVEWWRWLPWEWSDSGDKVDPSDKCCERSGVESDDIYVLIDNTYINDQVREGKVEMSSKGREEGF